MRLRKPENDSHWQIVVDTENQSAIKNTVIDGLTKLGFLKGNDGKYYTYPSGAIIEKLGKAKHALKVCLNYSDFVERYVEADSLMTENHIPAKPKTQKTLLVTYLENKREYVSHGCDADTLKSVCLPNEPLSYYIQNCGAKKDIDSGEWIMESVLQPTPVSQPDILPELRI